MRAHIELDDDLVNEALALTGARTMKELVRLALLELIAQRKKNDLFNLAGKIEFSSDFDHKGLRSLRNKQE